MDVVHRDKGDLEFPAELQSVAVGWRDASQMLFALVAYLVVGVWASPGRPIPEVFIIFRINVSLGKVRLGWVGLG